MRHAALRIAITLPLLLLAACATLLEREAVATYPLRGVANPSDDLASDVPARRRVAVAVERPLATGAVAGNRMIVEVEDELRFVSGARWEDNLPELLRADLGRALQQVSGIDVVDAAQRAGRADFALVTIIERMQVTVNPDYSGRAVTEIAARLVRLPARSIVATEMFLGEAPASDDAPGTLAHAISTATQQAISALTAWVAAETGAPTR